jgi:hypothetical protein
MLKAQSQYSSKYKSIQKNSPMITEEDDLLQSPDTIR